MKIHKIDGPLYQTEKNKMESMKSKSKGLSERAVKRAEEGLHLNDDSTVSESVLGQAIHVIRPYIEKKCEEIGATLIHEKSISLYDCQTYYHKVGGPVPDPENKKVCMKPDGGVFIMTWKDKCFPILIIEDKVQGTNDILFEKNKPRQSTGNAIERGAKNIRGAEMLFAELDIFPYVLFASGCDFHSSETISKRIEMMNMGFPNHYMEVSPNTEPSIDAILPRITIKKSLGKGIASVFVKAHKWDEMKHGSSSWKKEEIITLCTHVIDKVFESLNPIVAMPIVAIPS